MINRRILPPLFKDRVVRTTTPEENAKVSDAIARRKKFDEGKSAAKLKYTEKLKEGAMNRSYTMDEITTAQLLKGHPMAQEILDELNKGKKKNESGEEFQDGSEDTIGGDGHAAVARPATVHDGKKGGDNPGVKTKNASVEDGDLEKSDNLTDNIPEEFEDGMVGADDDNDDDGDVLVSKKSVDEECLDFLTKSWGSEIIDKAVIGGASVDPAKRRMLAQMPGGYKDSKKSDDDNALTNRKVNPTALHALKQRLGTGGAEKSEDIELEKSEDERNEDMSEKSWSMDFSKSILTNMGLEKGSPSVSEKVAGGKATQISYSSKPETRFKHPKQKKGETRYEHNVKEGTVTKKEASGEKGKFKEGKPIGVSEEAKLKNASEGGFDLHKALDEILTKKRD